MGLLTHTTAASRGTARNTFCPALHCTDASRHWHGHAALLRRPPLALLLLLVLLHVHGVSRLCLQLQLLGVAPSSSCCCSSCASTNHKVAWVDGDRLCRVVGLVDADQAVCQLKHVVAQADDNKLGVLCALLDVVADCVWASV